MIANQKHFILIVGLLFGVAFLGGYFVKDSTGPTLLWPENAAMAAGGAQDDSFAMAVGRVDSNVEGVYILDFLTGELTCTVLDYRGGKFRSIFKANVIKDLRIEQVGRRKFLMLSGEVNFPRGVGAAPRLNRRSMCWIRPAERTRRTESPGVKNWPAAVAPRSDSSSCSMSARHGRPPCGNEA